MSGNQGRAAHDHAFTALQLLYQYHWDNRLMIQVRDELQKAVIKLRQHLSKVQCPCGDQLDDIQYYQLLLEDVNWVIQTANLSPIPVVQESLQNYLTEKDTNHRCIHHLVQSKHDWIEDVV